MSTHEMESYKLRKLIQRLESTHGSGTSMITLLLKSGSGISGASKLLARELGAASNIKSRANRQSVQSAIRSAHAKLKLYAHVPANGLAIFCGEGTLAGANKSTTISEGFEPPRPIGSALYWCGSAFEVK